MAVFPAPPLTSAQVSNPTNAVVCMTPSTAVSPSAFGRTGLRNIGRSMRSATAPKNERKAANVKGSE